MKFNDKLAAILAGTAIASAIVITLPPSAMALTGEQVNDIAREVTVLITGDGGHGSGVIVSQNGSTYYVLTAYHVVASQEDYKIVTHDKKAYQLSNVKRLPGVDLAVVEFSSEQEYPVAKLANSDTITQGKEIFISGWPRPGGTGQLVRQFTYSRVSGFLDQPIEGYKMIYTNVTLPGMSGGPVIDAGGRVVAIHGMGDTADPQALQAEGLSAEAATRIARMIKTNFNYAIPINTFLQGAPQAGLYLGLQVDNSPAPELGAPYVASAQPDERDTIDNINDVLDTVGRTVDTINRVRNILRF